MATPDEVLDLLAGFRRAEGTVDRGRAAGAALKALMSLSAAEKRDVAVLVAERAAPELVPRIRAQTGADLTRQQVQVVLDMVGGLDAEDVEELRRTVADPEAREAALRSTASATAAAAAAAAGIDDGLPPPPPHLLEGEEGDEDDEDEAADDGLAAADRALADAEQRRREVEEQAERELAAAQKELEALEAGAAPEEVPEAKAVPEAATVTEEVDAEPAPYEPVFQPRDLPGDGGEAAPRPGRDVDRGVSPLAERIAAAGTNGARLRVLTSSLEEVLGYTAAQVEGVVRAIPDGWARRRAVERLLAHDAVLAEEVPRTVRLLERPSDRTWVAASAVEARLLDLDELDGLLDERAAARLRRRYG